MRADRSVLTLGEARVARLVAEGRTDAEIARQLAMSLGEIDRAVAEVLHKLDLRSRTELALLLLPPMTEPAHAGDAGPDEPVA